MQNVVGKLSRTPGAIRHTGPRLGEHNREVLMDLLGFSEAELAAQDIDPGLPKRTAASPT
jgi:crotonobetainyl-CoA:carnitine CoA-transferase CaiB-like acyl-CoA transferase